MYLQDVSAKGKKSNQKITKKKGRKKHRQSVMGDAPGYDEKDAFFRTWCGFAKEKSYVL